ncbi:MAG: phytanoyl-CoA dioxygenase family protein [Chloroflexota bacterium]
MNNLEQYEFDRTGYLVIPNLLSPDAVAQLAVAVDRLEAHAQEHRDLPPRITAPWGHDYHQNEECGYHVQASDRQGGLTLIIEDFFNFDPVFDQLVNEPKTMAYIRTIIQERPTINNSELRVRYTGNFSGTHLGGPQSPKYRYTFNQQGIDCMMVRMVYFVHDVSVEEGAFCVVPGTHKSNYASPYGNVIPEEEPGMIPLPVKAGDAILFTENLRHGGFANHSDQTRKTLHVGYGPYWMKSQNIATMELDPYILSETMARYDDEQRELFYTRPTPRI